MSSPADSTKIIALQLYSVREAFQQDPIKTLARVRAIGFEWVELAPMPEGLSDAVLVGWLNDAGLSVTALHAELPDSAGLEALVRRAECWPGCPVVWHGWPRGEDYATHEGIERIAARCNQVQSHLARYGIPFGLHNHWWEFEQLAGKYPFQTLAHALHPDVFLELDTYWIRTAGLSPGEAIAVLQPRVRLLHLKDGPAVQGQPMQALGDGVMDFAFLRTQPAAAVPWIVELDECATDMFEALDRSWKCLQRWRGAP